MNELFLSSSLSGLVLSLLCYEIGVGLKKKFKNGIFNPLLISIILVSLFLIVFNIDYEVYNNSAKYLTYLLTPATVCLAVPLYEEIEVLKKHPFAILISILSGVLTSLFGVFLLSILFSLSHTEYVTMLPKSITTAIGMPLSLEYGGYTSLTVVSIIITGVLGNISAPFVLKVFGIKSAVAKGVAIGTSSHAIGTTKALEMGGLEGAVSSLSLVTAGIMTIAFMPLFTNLI